MFYQALLLQSHRMDVEIQKKTIQKSSIVSFVDRIRENLWHLDSIEKLDGAMTMFRKWVKILSARWNDIYPQQLSALAVVRAKRYRIIEDARLETLQNLPHSSFDEESMRTLTRAVDPYSGIDEKELKRIDPDFVRKTGILTTINAGRAQFKSSRLSLAAKTFVSILNDFRETKGRRARVRISNGDVFFYSYALHQLGNICYVLGDLRAALELYDYSLRLKNSMPKNGMFWATKLKRTIVSACELGPDEWCEDVQRVFADIKSDLILKKENSRLYYNLLADASMHLGRSFIFIDEWEKAGSALKKAASFARKCKDDVGVVISHIFEGVICPSPRAAGKQVAAALALLPSRHSTNPYLRRVASRGVVSECAVLNEPYSKILEAVLFKASIKPLAESKATSVLAEIPVIELVQFSRNSSDKVPA